MFKKLKCLFRFIRNFIRKYFTQKTMLIDFLFDVEYFYKTRHFFLKEDRFFAFSRFTTKNITSDVGLVFFFGIGDCIYALPALKILSQMVRKAGFKLYGFVEEHTSRLANPAVLTLLEDTALFDYLDYFHGWESGYWKYYNWSSIRRTNRYPCKIFPCIYRTSPKIKDRILEVLQQFSLPDHVDWPEIKPKKTEQYRNLRAQLINKQRNNHSIIFVHLETRSGEYIYPHIAQFIACVMDSKLLKKNITFVLFSQMNVTDIQKNILSFDPKTIPLSDQIALIEEFASVILAITSFLWAIARMLKKRLLGIHYLDSDDGHQFWYPGAKFLTASRYVLQRIGEGVLAVEGTHFKRLANPYMLEYSPLSLYSMLIEEPLLLRPVIHRNSPI